jgi:type IV secretion system protein TrbL
VRPLRSIAILTLLLAAMAVGAAHAQTAAPAPSASASSSDSNWGLPAASTPADSKTGGAAGLRAFLGIPFGDMYARGMRAALYIFASLVAIELLVLSATMAFRQASFSAALGEWIQRAAKALVIIGVMPYTISIFGSIQSHACTLAIEVATGSTAQSVFGSGTVPNACTALSPATIFLYGLTHGAAVFATSGTITIGPITVPIAIGALNPGILLLEGIAWIGIVGSFFFIAADLLIILVESQIVLGLGIVFVGFLGSNFTSFLGRGIVHYAATILLRMFFVYAFVGVGIAVIDQVWDNAVTRNGFDSPSALLEATVTPLVFAWLTHRMDKIAASITTGSSQMNVRDDIARPIANAVKMAVSAAVTIAVGGAAGMALLKGASPAMAGAAAGGGSTSGGGPAAAGGFGNGAGPHPSGGSPRPMLPEGSRDPHQPQAQPRDAITAGRIDDVRALPARSSQSNGQSKTAAPSSAATAQPPPPAQNPGRPQTSARSTSQPPPEPAVIDAEYREHSSQHRSAASADRHSSGASDETTVLPIARPRAGSAPPPSPPPPEAAAPPEPRTPTAPTKKRPDRPPSDWRARAQAIASIRKSIHTHLDWHVERMASGTQGISARPPI